jgi:hypothetical protein
MLNTLLISYDLRTPGKDYSRLWNRLFSYGNYARPLESVWLIRTIYTAEQVRDSIRGYVDQNDKLFVVDVTGRPVAWNNLLADVVKWIGKTL